VGYVEQNLNPGERVLYTTHLHWVVLFRSILVDALFSATAIALLVWSVASQHAEPGEARIVGVCALMLLLFGNMILVIAVVRRKATEMAVTNKRVIIKVGFLTKRTVELFLDKVESVDVEQTLVGRMMGFGSVALRGTGGTNEPFPHVDNPLEFRRQVQNQIELHSNP
jgi:uncharacterized membrane protein YdbT with pleckstrin-like domain